MLAACGANPSPALLPEDVEKIEHIVDRSLPLVQIAYAIPNRKVCDEEGGEWKKLGIQHHESCVLPADDAGEVCTDSAQCEVACVAKDLGNKPGKHAEGICLHSTDLFGCHSYISNGIIEPTLCTD